MRILLDQGTPAPLRRALAGHSLSTAYEEGWHKLKNGELLAAAEGSSTCSSPLCCGGFVNWMSRTKYLAVAAAATLVFAVGLAPAGNAQVNAGTRAAGQAAAAPTQEDLMTLEKSGFEAWKNKDATFWKTFLSDKFVGYGSDGKLNKTSATKEYTGADCEIKNYALADDKMTLLGNDAALLTFKATVAGACGGQMLPVNTMAASVFVREGPKWKAVFYAEAPIVDPKAASAKPTAAGKKKEKAKAATANTAPAELVAAERAIWEAWRLHDAKNIAELTTKEMSFINILGTYFATKADALRDWTSEGCQVKSTSVTNATGTMLSPTVGILTFNGGADGTCFGQKVGPIWGTSIYVKDGNVWKWTFGINLPAG